MDDLRSCVVPERYDQLAPLSPPRPMSRVTFRQTSPFFGCEHHSRRWTHACIVFWAGHATSSDTKSKDGSFAFSTAVVADFGPRDWARQGGEESHRFVSPSMACVLRRAHHRLLIAQESVHAMTHDTSPDAERPCSYAAFDCAARGHDSIGNAGITECSSPDLP